MLYLFVEGPDDERFFSRTYGTALGSYKFIKYSGWTPAKINNFIRSIGCTPESEYIFIGDADGKSINEKKIILTTRYSNLESKRVYIVQCEIESWYYAGVDTTLCQKLKLKQYVYNTDSLTKEQFNAKLPKRADRKFIMTELLEAYKLELAICRNTSLSLFNAGIKKEPA